MILLDTDMLSLLHAGHKRVVEHVEQLDPAELLGTTVVTRGEVLRARFEYLFKASDGKQLLKAQFWLQASDALLADLHIVPVTSDAADEFERLRRQRKLKKIGRRDLLIASIALAHRAKLITRNLKHFRQIDGLTLENWAD
jgi:tRNA(fMet)-specific endonuclease VapC